MISKVSTFLGPSSIFGSGKTLPSLVLYLDAGKTQSYPGTGTNWYDLSTYHNNGVFNSTPTYSNVWSGSVGFDGSVEFNSGSSNYVFFDKKTLTFDGDSYNVTTGTNSVTPTTGAWDNGAWSVESYSGKVKLKYQLGGDPSSGTICGFSETPLAGGNSYDRVKYGFYIKAESPLSIWERNEVYTVSGTFSSSTVFSIVYDLSKVKYYIDDVLVYTSLKPLPTSPLYFYSTFQNNSIVNIEYGPYVESIPIGDSKYTIETWVQSNDPDRTNGGVIGWGSYGSNEHVNALRYSQSGGFTNYWFGNDLSTSNLSMTSYLYYHVVAKYDGTNRQIWVNGTMSISDTPGITNSVDTFSNLTVGKAWSSGYEYLNGSIGYLKLYNTSLSDRQIINSFNSTKERFGYVYGSFLFNDTNQYLSNTSIDYSFRTNDFTMEAFFNHATSSGNTNGILSLRPQIGGGVGVNLLNSDSIPRIEFYAADTPFTFTASNDTWYHVAISRVSGTSSFYVNGTLFTQVEDTTDYTDPNFVIGRYYNDEDNYYYNGIISNVRVINGTGIYTSDFTPPTTPLGVTASTRLLLLAQENMLVSDDSGNNEIVINNNGVGWTSSLPYIIPPYVTDHLEIYVDAGVNDSYPGVLTDTVGSIQFDGTNQYISTTVDAPGTFSTTYEWWFYQTNTSPSTQGLLQTRTGTSDGDGIDISILDGKIFISTSGAGLLTTATVVNINKWYHIAVVRNGDTNWTVYLNGSSVGTFDFSNSTGTDLSIGRKSAVDYNEFFIGYISNFRYVIGSAVYTSNFTPQTTAFPVISGTNLLLNTKNPGTVLTDDSGNSRVMSNPNGVIFNPIRPISLYDLSTNGFNMIIGSGSNWTSDITGGVIHFDGSYSGISDLEGPVNSSIVGVTHSGYSMEVMVKFDNVSDNYQGIFTFCGDKWGSVGFINLQLQTNTLRWEAGGESFTFGTFLPSTWYHIVATYNNIDNYLVVYVNGVLIGSHLISPDGYVFTSAKFVLGMWDGPLKGDVGFTRFYSKPLLAIDVSNNFESSRVRFGL